MGDKADYLLCVSAKITCRGQIMCPWQEQPRGRQHIEELSAVGRGRGGGVETEIWVHTLVLHSLAVSKSEWKHKINIGLPGLW